MKKLLVSLLCTAMLVTFMPVLTWADGDSSAASAETWAAAADTSWYDGESTEFTLYSAKELAGLAELVNSGTTFAGATVSLGENIDLSGKEWIPIGQKGNTAHQFEGTFNGNSKTIQGLTISGNLDELSDTNTFDGYVALFGAINNGQIKNITVYGSVAGSEAAGIAARINGTSTISNCINYADVFPSTKGGGIACLSNTGSTVTIDNCVNHGTITCINTQANGVGGIIGYTNPGICISNCRNQGVISSESKYAGGIAGYVQTGGVTISSCQNTGNVTGRETVGGIAGIITNGNEVIIKDCSNAGEIKATGESTNYVSAGGIAGSAAGTAFINCANSGGVSAVDIAAGIAGILNSNASSFDSCQNTGTLQTTNNHVTDNSGTIVMGTVQGAIVGSSRDTNVTIKNVDNDGGYELIANFRTSSMNHQLTFENVVTQKTMVLTPNTGDFQINLINSQLAGIETTVRNAKINADNESKIGELVAGAGTTISILEGTTLNVDTASGTISLSDTAKLIVLEGNGEYSSGEYTKDGSSGQLTRTVAKISDKNYASLEAAFNAVQDGETIILTGSEVLQNTLDIDAGNKTIILDLNGFNIKRGGKVIQFYNGQLTVTGTGTIEDTSNTNSAIAIKGSIDAADTDYTTVTVNEDVILKGRYGLFVTVNEDEQKNAHAYGVEVNMYGTAYGGLYINGRNQDIVNCPVMNIYTPARLESETGTGIYAAGYGIWNIEGAEIVGGSAGIGAKAGVFNLKDVKVAGTGDFDLPTSGNANGINSSGAAIQIESNSVYAGRIEFNITSGEFTSTYASAIYEYEVDEDTEDSGVTTLNIAGGTFTSAENYPSILTSDSLRESGKVEVSGGDFNRQVESQYLADGVSAYTRADGTITIAAQTASGQTPSIAPTPGYHWEEQADGTFREVEDVYIPTTPTTQLPTIEAGDNATVTLGSYGTVATITVADGYELVDVTVNGVSQGKVTFLYGLKTGDKVVVTTKKIQTAEEIRNAKLKAGVEATTLTARSKAYKGRTKITWTKSWGYMVDGYNVYKSTKRDSGYVWMGKTKKMYMYHTKNLKKGTRYYYRVKGYRTIGGEKVYTQLSKRAIRTAK